MKRFVLTGEFGHQDGQFIREVLIAKTKENAINNFKQRIKNGHYGSIQNVTINAVEI